VLPSSLAEPYAVLAQQSQSLIHHQLYF